MHIARTLPDLHAARARLPGPLAFVPTMGALHEGHLALIAQARAHAARVAASIYVNPTQFEDPVDLARYPRDEAADLAALERAGCDLAWLPGQAEMYPPGDATRIDPAGPALGWEGAARPGHFRGVATVVAKLFGQVRPDLALFGEKDWQQLQVVRRLAADLHLGVRVLGVPTLREPDGLAMSSRNRFLTPEERKRACRLALALRRTAARLAEGASAPVCLKEARGELREAGMAVEYLALVEAETLVEAAAPAPGGTHRLIAAARLGRVRLLDNMPLPLV